MMPLLEGETVTYHGRYYSVDDVFIEPRTGAAAGDLDRRRLAAGRPEVARPAEVRRVGQGARPSAPTAGSRARRARRRTSRATGTSSRRTSASTARTRPSCSVAHENFLHLVLTNDPAKAREEQHRAFLKVMSAERGPDYLETVYLFGTPDEIVASLQARVDAGVEYFILHTMTPDPAQLQTGSTRSSRTSTFPATAGPVRKPTARGRRRVVTRRVALLGKPLRRRHSRGHAQRRLRRGRHRRALRARGDRRGGRRRRPSRPRAAETGWASA